MIKTRNKNEKQRINNFVAWLVVILAIMAVGYIEHDTNQTIDSYCSSTHDHTICDYR